MTTEVSTRSLQAAARHVDQAVEAIFASVEDVRTAALGIADDATARHRRLRKVDLITLRPLLRHSLSHTRPQLAGTGLVLAVDVLEDAPRQLEWTRRAVDGSVAPLEPNLDPDSFGFYDFTAAPWFRGPERSRKRAVVGPYVDFSGTDEYVVTLTLPVQHREVFLGVAGADLRLGDLAEATMPALLRFTRAVCLVNDEDRVMVSTSPRWPVGSMLRERTQMRSESCRSAAWAVVADATA